MDVTGHPITQLTVSDLSADPDRPGTFVLTLDTSMACMNCHHVSTQWQITIAAATTTNNTQPTGTGTRKMKTEPGS